MSGTGRAAELRSLRARLQDRVTTSRTLMARVRTDNAALKRDAGVARAQIREQRSRLFTGWLAAYGVASTGAPLGHADALQLILDTAELVYGGCASISVTTVDQLEGDPDPYRTVCCTGVSRSVDALQYELREGPCIDAVELDAVTYVLADDLAGRDDARSWPRLCHAVEASGVRSSLSIAVPWSALRNGLQTEHRAVASINFYATEAHAFGQSETQAMFFSTWAGSMMSGRDPAELLDDIH
ncbi:hypothetical protein ACR9E3_22825 [Actinomycetospora sp. C-140]